MSFPFLFSLFPFPISQLSILNLILYFIFHSSLLLCSALPTEGKTLAASRDAKFIETSSGIQHNVDELLVGILKQVRKGWERKTKRKRKRKGIAIYQVMVSLEILSFHSREVWGALWFFRFRCEIHATH